jgi:hypothetical protein
LISQPSGKDGAPPHNEHNVTGALAQRLRQR